MLTAELWLWIGLLLLVLAGIGAGIWQFLRRGGEVKGELRQAWELAKSNPKEALRLFDRLLKNPKLRRNKLLVAKTHLGRAVCCVRLKDFEGAYEAETAAREQSPLSPEDLGILCKSYHLAIDATAPPRGALESYARYQLLAKGARDETAARHWADVLRKSVLVPERASADVLNRAIARAEWIRAVGFTAPWLHKAIGLIHLRSDRFAEAETALLEAQRLDAADADVVVALARIARRNGDLPAARRHALRAYRLRPDADSAYAAATACMRTFDVPLTAEERVVPESKTPLDLAGRLLTDVTEQRPELAPAWQQLGRVRGLQNRHRDAVDALLRARALDPALAGIAAPLGRAALALDDRTLARDNLAIAQKETPNGADTLRLAGDLAFVEGKFAEALESYALLGTPKADDGELLFRVASCELEAGNPARVAPLLAKCDRLSPEARLVLGRSFGRLGDWPKSVETLDALPVEQRSPTYRYYLAAAWGATGRAADAEKQFRDLQSTPELKGRCRRQLGHLFALAGKHEAAKAWYESAADDNAFDLGRVALLRRDWPEARRLFGLAAKDPSRDGVGRLGTLLVGIEEGGGNVDELLNEPRLAPFAHERLGRKQFDNNRYLQSLEHLEKAVKGRRAVPSDLLGRLADSCLILGRFAEALPHLDELETRFPRSVEVRNNLAWCRYRLGQDYFRKGRWDQAREEWHRAGHFCRPTLPAQAREIARAEREAAYRTVVDILAAPDFRGELDHARNLSELACKNAADEARWWFVAGLAASFAGEQKEASERFARASDLDGERTGFALGLALSQLALDRTDEAMRSLEKTLRLAAANPQKTQPLLPVAARFALASCHTRHQRWAPAAEALAPLIDDPLIQGSNRISSKDVARIVVAYFGLAGDNARAAEVARKSLGQDAPLSNLILGLIRIEGGDYAGAADTLEAAHRQSPDLAVAEVLVSCLLATAARFALDGDLKAALTFVRRALAIAPTNALAGRLAGAIDSGQRLKNLDLKQLDAAVRDCETMVKDSSSSQLLRTLAVLYHRRALQSELSSSAQANWDRCVDFWRKRLLNENAFWTDFEQEYNAGKKPREQLKKDDLAKWRQDVRGQLAGDHARFVAAYLRDKNAAGLQRHLTLIWEWDPDFVPKPDFLQKELQNLDDKSADLLGGAVPKIKAEKARKAIGSIAAVYWCGKAREANNRAVGRSNQSQAAVDQIVNLAKAMPESLRSVVLPQVKSALDNAIAQGATAVKELKEARAILDKAKKLAADLPDVKQVDELIEKNLSGIEKGLESDRDTRRKLP